MRNRPSRLLWIARTLLPRSFRERFGDDLVDLAADLEARARLAGGPAARRRYVLRELTSLLWLALNLRRDRNRLHGRGPTPKRLSNMETLYADLRWSLRLFRRRPGFAFTVCSTLAVAVAAAATAYGLARSVLWRPLPYPDESSLVFVWEVAEREGARLPMRVTGSRFDHWQRTSTSFASLAAFGAAAFSGEGPEGVTNLRGVRVSTNYFQTLGIAPALGRDFVAEDGVAGRNRVVLLSHAFWQQWFGGRRDVVGTTIRLSGESYTILGVMPPVVFPAWPANPAIVTLDQSARMFWVPIASAQLAGSTRAHVLGVVGRLRPHASRPQAEAELGAASPTAVDRHAARLIPFRDQFVEDARTPLLALLGAALAVLLTACANLAALQATSFESRRAELGIRLAVGAGRLRLARQLATESLVLALAAGAAGLALARLALTTLPPSLPPEVPFLTAPDLDGQVAAFGLAISLLAGACLAAWPIARAHGTSPTGRGVASSSSTMFRSLVAVQVALAMALAVSAGLLEQSLWSVRGQDPGFVVDRVVVMGVTLSGPPDAAPARVVASERRLTDAIAAVPGTSSVAVAYDHPLAANWRDSFALAGRLPGQDDVAGSAELRIVSPGYLKTMGVEVVDGRELVETDDLDAPGAVLVNEAFVRWAGAGPVLNRRIRSRTRQFNWGPGMPDEFRVVGIVEDERFRGLEHPAEPAVYMSTRQFPQRDFAMLVRTAGDPQAAMSALRAAVRAIDPAAAIGRVRTLDAILREQLAERHMTTGVINGFAGAALALAVLGLYGLLILLVAGRMRETGIRIALGASPSAMVRQIVGTSVATAAIGVAAGILLALAAGSLLESLLVGISARDVTTVVVVSVLLLIVAAVTALPPARRAARIDPAIVLRGD